MLDNLNEIKTKNAILKDKQVEQTKYLKAQQKIEESLKLVRTELLNFFDDKDLPIKELILKSDDEGLFIKTENGELPFDDKQMSTSTMMLITLKIMFYVNQETPILLLGKLESFDDDSMNTIIKFTKDNDCQIIADKVTNDNQFIFELIVDIKNSEKLLEIDTNKVIDVNITTEKSKSKKKVIKKIKKEIKDISEVMEDDKKDDIIEQVELF